LLLQRQLDHYAHRLILVVAIGAGECGKSTLLKQMRILHLNGFSEDEKRSVYRPLILKNTVESMQSLCEACEHLDIGFDSPDNKRRSGVIQKVSPQKVPLDIVDSTRILA
jgi:guanine nucleotide-binding protein G(i) subunit alpha